MEKNQHIARKITDKTLMQFAHTDSDEMESVIMELDLPEPKVELKKVQRRGIITHAPVRVAPESSEQSEENERKITAARDFLNTLLDRPAKWLWAPRVFIANVTPSQIREIAKFPFIKVIHPNKTY